MSVKIRLSRIGKKQVPFYRVVVVDSRKKRDGQCLADIGTYDAIKSKLVQFDKELYDAWVLKGAQVSDSAKRVYAIFKRDGIKEAKKVNPVVDLKVEATDKIVDSRKKVSSLPETVMHKE